MVGVFNHILCELCASIGQMTLVLITVVMPMLVVRRWSKVQSLNKPPSPHATAIFAPLSMFYLQYT